MKRVKTDGDSDAEVVVINEDQDEEPGHSKNKREAKRSTKKQGLNQISSAS